jgi:hypothetical protein
MLTDFPTTFTKSQRYSVYDPCFIDCMRFFSYWFQKRKDLTQKPSRLFLAPCYLSDCFHESHHQLIRKELLFLDITG